MQRTKEGIWGKSPSGVQGQSPGVGLGRSSQKLDINANFQLRWGDMHPCPPWLRH